MKKGLFVFDNYIGALILILFIVYLFIKVVYAPGVAENTCKKEKDMNFNGVVKFIKLDSMNTSRKFIFLDNGAKIIPPYTYGLWNEVKIGDSIVKESGVLNYIIFSDADSNRKRILNWDRPCD